MFLKILNRLLPALLNNYQGKRANQDFFERLYKLGLKGMQIGGGTSPESSGEAEALYYIKQKLHGVDSPVLFDVGANVGHYTQLLDMVFGKACRIYAFEPSARNFGYLQEAISNLSQVQPVQAGMGGSNSEMRLFSNEKKSGLSSVYNRRLDHLNISLEDSEWITILTIDGFCHEKNIQYIDFLKLDVEGHEFEILNGAREMLQGKKIRFIQFEFGGCNIDSRTFFQDFFYLLTPCYNLYRIVQDGLYPINRYKEIYEVFTTTNFLAELRQQD
jgi:FkbM family methyltransferase